MMELKKQPSVTLHLKSICRHLGFTTGLLVVVFTTAYAQDSNQPMISNQSASNTNGTIDTAAFGDESISSLQESNMSQGEHGRDKRDPFEKVNRHIFRFNRMIDTNIFKPMASIYKELVPEPVYDSVGNFFTNLNQPWTAANQAMQGKYRPALKTTARFIINTSTSLGLADAAATALNLSPDDEDFGQTLGTWGVKAGPYLMLPFLGPRTIRDLGGMIVDWAGAPLGYVNVNSVRYPLATIKYTHLRASLINYEDTIQGDPYDFVKNIYLQKREYDILDGNVAPDQSMNFGFGDESIDSNQLPAAADIKPTERTDTNLAPESLEQDPVDKVIPTVSNSAQNDNLFSGQLPRLLPNTAVISSLSEAETVAPTPSALDTSTKELPQTEGLQTKNVKDKIISEQDINERYTPAVPLDVRAIKKYVLIFKELAL